jgi:hypothetical protein
MLPQDDQDNTMWNDPRDPAIITKDGGPFVVPAEGSLSLLALGYRGLLAWRAKRASRAKERTSPEPGPDEQA